MGANDIDRLERLVEDLQSQIYSLEDQISQANRSISDLEHKLNYHNH